LTAPTLADVFARSDRIVGRRIAGEYVLVARSFPPPWERAAAEGVVALCARTAQAVPCARLRVRPDGSAPAAVLAALSR